MVLNCDRSGSSEFAVETDIAPVNRRPRPADALPDHYIARRAVSVLNKRRRQLLGQNTNISRNAKNKQFYKFVIVIKPFRRDKRTTPQSVWNSIRSIKTGPCRRRQSSTKTFPPSRSAAETKSRQSLTRRRKRKGSNLRRKSILQGRG